MSTAAVQYYSTQTNKKKKRKKNGCFLKIVLAYGAKM